MPRVPTYDTLQVAPTALPGVRESSVASPALFGAAGEQTAAVGKSLASAGASLAAVAEHMQAREDADMLFRAETALKEKYIQHEQAIRERKGQNAWGATKDTEKWFDDQEKEHAQILQNDTQRRLFNQSITKLRLSSTEAVSRYEADERRRSLEESAQASIVGSINAAASAAAVGGVDQLIPAPPTIGADGQEIPSPEAPKNVITGIKSDILKRVQVMADLNGWSLERKAVEEGKYLTSLHTQILQNLTIADPAKAKTYFDTYKNEINGADREGVEKLVREGTLREVAQKATDEISAKGLPLAEALAEVRKKYSGEEEDEIARRIKERFAEQEAAAGLDRKQAADAAWKTIAEGGGRNEISPAVWNKLGGVEQKQVLDYVDARAKRLAAKDKELKDDLGNLDTVEKMIERGDITDRAGLAKYDAFFTKSTLKTLANKIDKRGIVAPAELRRVFEDRKGDKVNVARMSDSERNEWMAFQDYILENVRETRRPEDVDVWADRWFMKGYGTQDAWYVDDPGTYGEARARGRKDFVIATPPVAQPVVDQALGILQRNGVAPPQDPRTGRDDFYTNNALEAERWAAAHGVAATPQIIAAHALLKRNKKPVTPANIEYVIGQLK